MAVGKKDWSKYGVHLLKALFALLDDLKPDSVKHFGKTNKDIVFIEFKNSFEAVIYSGCFSVCSRCFRIVHTTYYSYCSKYCKCDFFIIEMNLILMWKFFLLL